MKAVMYHYVRPYDADLPLLNHLRLDDFRRQLDHFEHTYGFVSRKELDVALAGGPVPAGVVLTFDDALSCHYEHVFPELVARGLWGIFYVPTGPYVNASLLGVHKIHLLTALGRHEEVHAELESLIEPHMLQRDRLAEYDTYSYATHAELAHVKAIKKTFNYFLDYRYRDAVLDELCCRYVPAELLDHARFYVPPERLVEMERGGMVIGSHTVTHPVLSKLPAAKQRAEIHDSFAFLRDAGLDLSLRTFCYPYGGFHTFTTQTIALLERADCAFTFNVEARDIVPVDLAEAPQALPRFDCNRFPHGQVRHQTTTKTLNAPEDPAGVLAADT